MRRLLLLPVFAIALIASACVTAEIEIRVNDDGSGTVGVLFAFDRATLEAFAEGEEIPDMTEDIDTSTLPEGAVVESVDTETQVGVKVTVPFAAGADVGQTINDTFKAVGGEDGEFLTGEEGLFETFVLRQEGDLWVFDATTDTPPPSEDLAFATTMFGDAKMVVRIALPGEVTEQNADRVEEDGALVWELPMVASQSRTLSARSDVSEPGLNIALITGIAIAVVVAGGIGFAALRRRSGGAAA